MTFMSANLTNLQPASGFLRADSGKSRPFDFLLHASSISMCETLGGISKLQSRRRDVISLGVIAVKNQAVGRGVTQQQLQQLQQSLA